MSIAEGKMEKKKPLKAKKPKKQHSKKEKIDQTKPEIDEVTEDQSVLAKKPKKQHKKKHKIDQTKPEIDEVIEDQPVLAKKPKKQHKKKQKTDQIKSEMKEVTEDKSVFAVTERLLQNKKAKKEKKTLEGIQKKELSKKTKKDEQLAEMKKFFQADSDTSEVKEKSKPKWFDANVKTLVTGYLVSVENCEKDDTLQNKTIRQQNEKKLYRFFHKLSTKLGEDMTVMKHWFHVTKKNILKSGTLSKPDAEDSGVLKIALLNRKIKAISKETTESPVPKSDVIPTWFDEEFAKLLKIRNKAKRQFQQSPTEENKTAYRQAFKRVKTELTKRKKSGFVSTEPYVKDSGKPIERSFGTKKVTSNKTFGNKNNFKPNHKSFGPQSGNSNKTFGAHNGVPNKTFGGNIGITANSNRKHIKFDD